jgi:tRNA dimethylallyltransferase
MAPRVIAVFGPTASGKSAAAVELAERVGGEIVSTDAMQLYRGLPILTNQPTAGETERVPHHLFGVWPLDHEGSVAEYGGLVRGVIDDLIARGRVPVLCGGSGLYLRSAVGRLETPPRAAPGTRARLEQLYDRVGAGAAHALLSERDPGAAKVVHANDRRRVVRALELAESGDTLVPARSTLWAHEPHHPTVVFGLDVPREELRARIEQRTEAMFEAGVTEEVRDALAGAISSTAARIHGLQDVSALVAGEIDRDEAIRRLVLRTRQYAKRQRVWMRRLPGVVPVRSAADMLERL